MSVKTRAETRHEAEVFAREFALCEAVYLMEGHQREGQRKMNALRTLEPDLYDLITGTEADCFYDDRKVPAFMEAVFG